MSIIQTLLVDDELPGLANLRLALEQYPNWTICGECKEASTARTLLSNQTVDVVFLDIRMPRESGLSLAKWISQLERAPIVIFVTAYSEHALEAFEWHALDYLVKPFDDQRFAKTIQRAEALIEMQQGPIYQKVLSDYLEHAEQPSHQVTRLAVRHKNQLELIPTDAILAITSAGNYAELHLTNRTLLHRITMNKLAEILPAHFIRTHRTAMVRQD
ncbi:MAG: response regulator transcription factor, partial [Acidobacteria bacterium]|nr:response regulator transcription factor [Acidobacteriota bacterium]